MPKINTRTGSITYPLKKLDEVSDAIQAIFDIAEQHKNDTALMASLVKREARSIRQSLALTKT